MNKIITALTLIIFTACAHSDDSDLTFEDVTADKVVILSNDNRSPRCSVHVNIPQVIAAAGHRGELINDAVIKRLLDPYGERDVKVAAHKFVESYTDTYMKTMLPLYNQDRADTTKRSWYEYHYIIDATTQKGLKNSVVYLATIDYYEGGSHGINQLLNMNFDAKTGRQLTLNDIFASGFEESLKKILLDALKAKTGCKSLRALHEKGYLFSQDIFPSENFILGESTITFVYNPYEIAPRSVGSIELIIPYSDLSKILKNSFEY